MKRSGQTLHMFCRRPKGLPSGLNSGWEKGISKRDLIWELKSGEVLM